MSLGVGTGGDEVSEAVFDASAVLERFGGDWTILTQVRDAFLEEYPRQLAEVRLALDAGSPPALAASAHKLKGSVAIFEAAAVTHAAAELEALGGRGDLAGAAAIYETLDREIGRLADALVSLAP